MRLMRVAALPALALHLSGCMTAGVEGAAARLSLLQADRAFSARSQEIGAGPAFLEYAAEDVRAFPNGRATIMGKEALSSWTAEWPSSQRISWGPEEAHVSERGDFGYTWGYAEYRSPDADGGPDRIAYGKYVTVWRRTPTGAWRWIADLGNGAPPPSER